MIREDNYQVSVGGRRHQIPVKSLLTLTIPLNVEIIDIQRQL
jgi:hypothetical protein